MVVRRFEVYLINLDPTLGSEIQKTRSCLIISPDEMNHHIATVIAAPMTTKGRDYPTRVHCQFDGKPGQIVLDQIRTIDKIRLVKKLGKISPDTQAEVLAVLQEMFSEETQPSCCLTCRALQRNSANGMLPGCALIPGPMGDLVQDQKTFVEAKALYVGRDSIPALGAGRSMLKRRDTIPPYDFQ